jgi:hypothetical protein
MFFDFSIPRNSFRSFNSLEDHKVPLCHSQLFSNLRIKLPRGLFIYELQGWDKALITRAIANEIGANLYMINGPEIMSKLSGRLEGNLRQLLKFRCVGMICEREVRVRQGSKVNCGRASCGK